MRRVALFSYRRRRSVLIGWIVLLVAVFALSQTAGGVYRNELALSGSESAAAFDLLEERGFADRAGFSGQIVFEAEQGLVPGRPATVTRRHRGHRYRRW